MTSRKQRDAILKEALDLCEGVRESGCEATAGAVECINAIQELRAQNNATMEPNATGHKDCAGRSIFAGDTVGFMQTGYTYAMQLGKIVGHTAQKIKIEFKGETVLKFPAQVAIVK